MYPIIYHICYKPKGLPAYSHVPVSSLCGKEYSVMTDNNKHTWQVCVDNKWIATVWISKLDIDIDMPSLCEECKNHPDTALAMLAKYKDDINQERK